MNERMRVIFTFMVGVLVTSIFYIIIPMDFYSYVVGVFTTLAMMTAWEDTTPKKKEDYKPKYVWKRDKNDKETK